MQATLVWAAGAAQGLETLYKDASPSGDTRRATPADHPSVVVPRPDTNHVDTNQNGAYLVTLLLGQELLAVNNVQEKMNLPWTGLLV